MCKHTIFDNTNVGATRLNFNPRNVQADFIGFILNLQLSKPILSPLFE